MKRVLHLGVPLYILLLMYTPASAQHHDTGQIPDHRPFRVAVLIGHTLVPATGGAERAFIPSWGLDLEYWPVRNWGIGLHNDLEIETFLVEGPGDELVDRRYPVVLTLDVLYRPWKGLVLQAGPGLELEQREDFFLFRFGLEYEFELGHYWDIAPSVYYDTRRDAFDTYSVALGVGKRF